MPSSLLTLGELALVNLANEARVECDAKVFRAFWDMIPAETMEQGRELERMRQRSDLITYVQLVNQCLFGGV